MVNVYNLPVFLLSLFVLNGSYSQTSAESPFSVGSNVHNGDHIGNGMYSPGITIAYGQNNSADMSDTQIKGDVHLPTGTRGLLSHETLIYHDGGYSGSGIGREDGGAMNFSVAARFTQDDLSDHYGKLLTDVRIYVQEGGGNDVTILIWEGGSLSGPGNPVYEKNISSEVVLDSWTIHKLTDPVVLQEDNEYWIGYNINATGGHPAGHDAGPMVQDKGGWIFWDNQWYQLSDFNFGYNFNIRGRLEEIQEFEDEIVLRHFVPDEDTLTSWNWIRQFEDDTPDKFLGLIHGYNHRLDRAMAVAFDIPYGFGNSYLREVRIWWALKNDEVSDETYLLEILDGTHSHGPNTSIDPIHSTVYPLSEINAVNNDREAFDPALVEPTIYTIDPPVSVPSTFFVSVYFGEYNMEEGEWLAGIAATLDQKEGSIFSNWLLTNDGNWETIYFPTIFGDERSPDMYIEAVIAGEDVVFVDGSDHPEVPLHFALRQNYPNPFNPSTVIGFHLPASGFVTLKIYNVLGEEVATLVNEERIAGSYEVTWDATGFASGVYFYRLSGGNFTETKKLVLMQ